MSKLSHAVTLKFTTDHGMKMEIDFEKGTPLEHVSKAIDQIESDLQSVVTIPEEA